MSVEFGTHSIHSTRFPLVKPTSVKVLISCKFELALDTSPFSSDPRCANSSWKMSTVSFVCRASSTPT